MGHATRCIPVIRACKEAGAELIVTGSPAVINRLRQEFPEINFFSEELFVPAYSKRLPAWLKILLQLPYLLKSERSSYARIQSLVESEQIDLIISDNRYFVYSGSCKNILISHQLNPQLPGFLSIFQKYFQIKIAGLCKPFQQVWIPDTGQIRPLSGILSENPKLKNKIVFCGILSRFQQQAVSPKADDYDLLILSGPAPQPEVLFQKIARLYRQNNKKLRVISSNPFPETPHVSVYVSPNNTAFVNLVQHARQIICRPGYTTIMDLITLKRSALLIPTPGQTEQEYLAGQLINSAFSSLAQSKINAIAKVDDLPFPTKVSADTVLPDNPMITDIIRQLINRNG